MKRSDLTDLLYPVFNSCGPGDIICNPDFYKICVHCIYVLDMKLVLFNLLTYLLCLQIPQKLRQKDVNICIKWQKAVGAFELGLT